MNISSYRKSNWNLKYIWLVIFFFYTLFLNAQTEKKIKVNVGNTSLSEILKTLTEEYNFQLSYDSYELSKYDVTVHKEFDTPEKTIRYLLNDLPFKVINSGEVFIIVPQKSDSIGTSPEQRGVNDQKSVSGQVVEFGSNEALPYSQILVNGEQIYSDILGNFKYISTDDSVFHIQIYHLGYFIKDTILLPNMSHHIALKPFVGKLPEIKIKNNIVEKSALIGTKPGNMQLNYQISQYLPGQGDNSVFTLLKLMPGVEATGEQSNDLEMWGSYEGQSLITFDEFTLFGLRNYNENINVINPFLIKNIEIEKGGYEAKYGNRVGGLVNITSKNGNREKPTLNVNINSSTINGMAEVPLFHRSSLVLAYRQTYYNLYNTDDFNVFAVTHPDQNVFRNQEKQNTIDPDISVYPDKYNFRDFNIKYSYHLKNGDFFYVSYYHGGDVFNLATDAELERTTLTQTNNIGNIITNTLGINETNNETNTVLYNVSLNNKEENKQQGLSFFYNRKWKNDNLSKLIFAHANFCRNIQEEVSSSDSNNGDVFVSNENRTINKANENSIRSENSVFLKNGYKFEFGGGVYFNQTKIKNDNNYTDNSNLDTLNQNESNRGYLYAQQTIPVTKKLKIIAGVRGNLTFDNSNIFAEPRARISYKFSDAIKIHASWGLYNQMMYKIATVDRDDNYTYLWTTCTDNTKRLNALHWVSGFNYNKNNFTVNIEGYYKKIHNLTRRYYAQTEFNNNVNNSYLLYSGNARTYGADIYLRKDFGYNAVWASYSLSKAEEQLSYGNEQLPDYSSAPQDQRHEFKIASLINFRSFYFSASYIYGSGMNILKEMFDTESGLEYNRVDLALTYNFRWKRMSAETGISVLNVFDTQNLTPRNVKTINISEEIDPIKVYTDAVPFTPIFFIKAKF